MADLFTPEKRSDIMSRIKSKNSKAEKIVFAFLRKEGVYFQKHYSRVMGKPDIALPRKRIAVFIDGDFWHGHDYARVVNVTKSPYWVSKIKANMERDEATVRKLSKDDWLILRVWESDILRKRTRNGCLVNIKNFLTH